MPVRRRQLGNRVNTIVQRTLTRMRDVAVRERAAACATFALIFVFAAGSMDFLISGGPDWNPGAPRAPQIVRAEVLTTPLLHQETAWTPPPALPFHDVPEFVDSGRVGELLGGPDMIFASSEYFDSASFNGEGDAPGVAEIGKPFHASFSTAAPAPVGKEKPPTTVS
jgi:hypothetical protein